MVEVLFCGLIIYFWDYVYVFFKIITSKLDGTNVSYIDREDRFAALDRIGGINLILGYGPGSLYTLNIDSYISLYLGIIMNMGLVGAFSFFIFVIKQYKSIQMIRDRWMRAALLISFVMTTLHFAVVDIIYYAWYWIVLAIAWVVIKKEALERNLINNR